MSIRNSPIIGELLKLLYPPKCLICGAPTDHLDQIICRSCFKKLPFTFTWLHRDNDFAKRVRASERRIANAATLLHYSKGINWHQIIYALKYHRCRRYGVILGRLLGGYMLHGEHFNDVDIIIPVPLHPLRKLSRGYNQSDYIARGIAQHLKLEVERHAVIRHRYNASQTKQSLENRSINSKDLFKVVRPELLRGKHLLLVDDIYTTGATILSLAKELYSQVDDLTISIATIGVVKNKKGTH